MAKKPSASISKLTFSGGDSFALAPNEKIILVGPNNCGKSQAMRDISYLTKGEPNLRPFTVVNVELEKKGTTNELADFLHEHAKLVSDKYQYGNWTVPISSIGFWDHYMLPEPIRPGFFKKITADGRLAICDQQPSIGPDDAKSKPQHVLYDDEALMARISHLFRLAFGKSIMFDFRGGSKVPIHVGTSPAGMVDRVSDTYVDAVRQYPLLHKQGDGMRSFAGILFETLVTNVDITLLDEPEAFLHPPQMRLLGSILAEKVSGQLIVATHSSDVLRGFLEGAKGRVRILRLDRKGSENMVTEAPPEVIENLWKSPVLRYSNALEGIFHEQTIICEDDSDCRLINCVEDYLSGQVSGPRKDTAYVPTGGKHGIPKVAGVLRQIGAEVKAVFDIDFLSEKSLVRDAVRAFGGEWKDFEPLWTRVNAEVCGGIEPKSAAEIKGDIVALLHASAPDEVPTRLVREALKQGAAWNVVKKFGERGLPNGQAQTNYAALRDKLESVGIYVVPVGEIENFCPHIGLHGPRFVTKLLEEVQLDDARLEDLRSFVARVHAGRHGIMQ